MRSQSCVRLLDKDQRDREDGDHQPEQKERELVIELDAANELGREATGKVDALQTELSEALAAAENAEARAAETAPASGSGSAGASGAASSTSSSGGRGWAVASAAGRR